MTKIKLPEDIISFFDEHGISLTAEAWRDPREENSAIKQAVLSLDGSRSTLREYIDGSKIIEAGFEVRLRVRADSLKDRLDAAEFFRKVSSAVSDKTNEKIHAKRKLRHDKIRDLRKRRRGIPRLIQNKIQGIITRKDLNYGTRKKS